MFSHIEQDRRVDETLTEQHEEELNRTSLGADLRAAGKKSGVPPERSPPLRSAFDFWKLPHGEA